MDMINKIVMEYIDFKLEESCYSISILYFITIIF